MFSTTYSSYFWRMLNNSHPILTDFRLVVELDFIRFYSSPCNEILVASFKESNTIDKQMAKESLDAIISYKNGRTIYGITDASAKFIEYKKEALDYFRQHMIPSDTAIHALVVADKGTRIIANLYARFDKPKMPTRVFNHIDEAHEWILENK